MVQGTPGRVLGESDGGCSVGLGVTVDEKCGLVGGSQAGREIHGGSGLPYSAFLIRYRDDSCQISPKIRLRAENLAKSKAASKMFHVEQSVGCGRFICSTRNNIQLDDPNESPPILFHVEHFGQNVEYWLTNRPSVPRGTLLAENSCGFEIGAENSWFQISAEIYITKEIKSLNCWSAVRQITILFSTIYRHTWVCSALRNFSGFSRWIPTLRSTLCSQDLQAAVIRRHIVHLAATHGILRVLRSANRNRKQNNCESTR